MLGLHGHATSSMNNCRHVCSAPSFPIIFSVPALCGIVKQIYVLGCTDGKVTHFRLDEANGVVVSDEEFSGIEDASTTLFKIEVTDDVIVGARQDSDEVRVLPGSGPA